MQKWGPLITSSLVFVTPTYHCRKGNRIRVCADEDSVDLSIKDSAPKLNLQQPVLTPVYTRTSSVCVGCEDAMRLSQVERRRNVALALASSLAASALYGYQSVNPSNPIKLLQRLEDQSLPLQVAFASDRGTIIDFYATWVDANIKILMLPLHRLA